MKAISKLKMRWASISAAVCLICGALALPARAQPAATLPPGVQDVVKLVKAGLGEPVVLAHIRNAGAFYKLSADQIIYLHEQGVSQNEITALMGDTAGTGGGAPTSAAPVPATAPTMPPQQYSTPPAAPPMEPVASAPATQTPSLSSFEAQLSPYGSWMQVSGYGLCWRPNVTASDPLWRPYADQGHWSYTADGWYWQSEYPWGNIAFHYGRWYRDTSGWVWVPGYDWAPAWVCWRQADEFCGWAPLPPGASFRVGMGLMFGGRVAVDVDFGLGADAFVFVGYDHFWDHHWHTFILPRERAHFVYAHSVIRNGYHYDHGRFVVEGLGHERIAMLTHHEVKVEEVRHDRDVHAHEADRRVYRDDHRDQHDR